jgi:hypothetical protein
MSRFVKARPLETPRLTLNACIAAACDAANTRMRAAGRKEWDAIDYDLALRLFCHHASRLPEPYPKMASEMLAEHRGKQAHGV